MWDVLPSLGFDAGAFGRVEQAIRVLGTTADWFAEQGGLEVRNLSRLHIRRALDEVAQLRARLEPAADGLPDSRPWSRSRTLRRLASVAMITPRAPDGAGDEGEALLSKVLFQCQQDILDDLVDRSAYPFERALALYTRCADATVRAVDPRALEEDLAAFLRPGHRALAAPLAAIAVTLRDAIRTSPHGLQILPTIARVGKGLALSQAGMAHLRAATWNPKGFRQIGERLEGPDRDLSWEDRLAVHMTWTLTHALLDLCFAEEAVPARALEATVRAWYYLNGVVTYLDHGVGLDRDFAGGIANAALVMLRGEEALERDTLSGWSPAISDAEYGILVDRAAGFTLRALAATEHLDEEGLYPFLSVMVPAVLMGAWRGGRDALIRRHMRGVASARVSSGGHHSTVYSQNASPLRTQWVFATLPSNPRNFRTPS